jgi:amino acid adenylation domain-containing protein
MLDELIEEQVERSPDSVAVLFEDRRLTYRELDDRANRLARYLQACGVGPGALVGICVERSLEMLVGLLGILKSGGAYVPLDPAYPTERLSFMIEDCRPRVLVTVDSLQARIPAHNARVICLDAPFDWTEEWNLRRAARQASDLAYLLYTSGSTGKPNGVEIPHRAFVNLLTAMRRSPGLNPGDKLLAVTTPSFDIAGLELFLPLISGACVVIAGQETIADGARLSSLMKRRAVTVMQATPSTWRILVEAGWKGSSELKVLCGGEPWSSELAEALLPRCKTLWNMYGPTETTIWSSATRIESGGRVLIGSPIANTTFYVLDRHRQLVPIGVPGELYIGGQGVARGYFNRPDLTKERFLTDPLCRERQGRMYKTGDSVRRLASGAIEFLNRIDQQVKLRGFRIELGEIEAVLKQHPEVDQCVALVREDSGTEKRLTAYIVLSDPRGELRTLELRDFVKSKLPEYMVPGVFIALARFPLTPNGKIDRKALTAAKYAPSEFAAAQPSGAPATVTELLVSKIWERTLDVGTIGAQDNFFDLGGHSLLAVQLVNEINKTLHASLTLPIFFLNPTIAGIAKVLQSGKFTKSGPHLIPLRETGSNGAIFFLDASMAMCRLAQLLDVELDLFATEAPLSPAAYRAALLNMKAALPCIEELAVPHVKLIRSAPFSGPCLLAGHSFNGLLAFEVAHQLYREGTSVEMILLMDAWIKTPPLWDRLRLLSFSQARNALINRVERLCSTAFRRIDGIVRGSYSAHGADSASFRPLVELQWVVRERVYNKARSGGQWLPLECRGVLFRSRDKRMDRFSAADRAIGWEGLFAGGLEVRVTPGDHLSLLEEPQINVLADKVNDCLAHYRTKAMRVAAH